jgi:methionyl-tRNA formyltransferase
LKILFLGTADFACPSLEALAGSPHKILEAVTQPDRPKGRGRKLAPPPVKTLALRYHLPVFQPERLREPSAVEHLKSLGSDLIVVVAYGQILSPAVLSIPPRGCVNVHGSILPKFRGAAPIARALMAGEKKTGVTTMLLDPGMDTGPILNVEETEITSDDNLQTLHDRLARIGARLLLKTIAGLEAGTLSPHPQDNDQATYAPKISREEGRINWETAGQTIDGLIRAFDPWPGAYTTWKGKAIKLFCPSILPGRPSEPPGTVAEASPQGIKIAAVDAYLLIREVQMENRSRMATDQFLRGNLLESGQHLGD